MHEINVDIGSVVSPWFRTLLSDFVLFQPSTVLRIWDDFFLTSELNPGEDLGWNVLYRCLLVVFAELEEQMLSMGLEGTMRLLWNIRSEREDVYNMDAATLLLAGDRIVLEEEEEEEEARNDVLTFQPPSEPPPPTGVTAVRGLFEPAL